MDQPKLVDASGSPVEPSPLGLRKLLRWPGVAGWTLFVLGIQALALVLQLGILRRQTALMERDASITETAQKLVTRPDIIVGQIDPLEGIPSKTPGWKIENRGPYSIHDLKMRLLHFKKFVNHGWDVVATPEVPVMAELKANQISTLDLRGWTDGMKHYDIAGLSPVDGAEFVIVALQFSRDVDEKGYLYLIPFMDSIGGDGFEMIRPQSTSTAGPLASACDLDTYAVELAFEYYRRNPSPYPV
ncbi:MAG: hypothetical protein WAM91_09185 [Candidatus Acidiferrales bacterium]